MKMKLFLRTERLCHKIINATNGYNRVTKHGTVIYGHKNELGCAMAQVVAASLSWWRLQSSPVQPNPCGNEVNKVATRQVSL
jgi:hypothetical protein